MPSILAHERTETSAHKQDLMGRSFQGHIQGWVEEGKMAAGAQWWKTTAEGRKTLLRGMREVEIVEYMPEKRGEARRNIQYAYLEIYLPLKILKQKAK